jgi:hypothetical protein
MKLSKEHLYPNISYIKKYSGVYHFLGSMAGQDFYLYTYYDENTCVVRITNAQGFSDMWSLQKNYNDNIGLNLAVIKARKLQILK